MKHDYSTEELKFLADRRLYSEIARKVPSPRARRIGATVSALYVRKTLQGEVKADSITTRLIKQLANYYIKTLFANTQAKNL